MKTFAIVGTGYRGLYMFGIRLIQERYKDLARLAAICDPNGVRMDFFEKETAPVAKYKDFSRMLDEIRPDYVIVTTPDYSHDRYIVEALDKGCEVISEKPMTITAEKAKAIREAEQRNGRKVQVIFNMRYMPLSLAIKKVFASGKLGTIENLSLDWYLDRVHGADYFRRWHRQMKNSGGLLLHKSTHHFDLMNWFLDDVPEEVFANGKLAFYGHPKEGQGTRCRDCALKNSCPFYWDVTEDPRYRAMYFEAEKEDGYIRDACVFSPEIDIYDTVNAQVRYRHGAFLNYTLTAFAPYEGWRLAANGTKGRLEVFVFTSGERKGEPSDHIDVYYADGTHEVIEVVKKSGSHGGADDILLADLIEGGRPDPYHQKAGTEDGANSLIIGAAANLSIKSGQPVLIKDLL